MIARILIFCILFTTVQSIAQEVAYPYSSRVLPEEVRTQMNSLSQSLTRKFSGGAPGDWGSILSVAIKRFEPLFFEEKLFYYGSLIEGQTYPGIQKFLNGIARDKYEINRYSAYISRFAEGQLRQMLNGFSIATIESVKALHSLSQSLKQELRYGYLSGDWGLALSEKIKRFEPSSGLDKKAYYSSLLLTRSYKGIKTFLDNVLKTENADRYEKYISRLALAKLRASVAQSEAMTAVDSCESLMQ